MKSSQLFCLCHYLIEVIVNQTGNCVHPACGACWDKGPVGRLRMTGLPPLAQQAKQNVYVALTSQYYY